ncbi:MAG: putative zinc-binding protein [Gammaproteobacteria bacterium]|nr:putative zinc-binding protein [Gammaproteobacteria bacterium]
MSKDPKPPLVYSCSGASSAAQMANYIAVRLDRLGVAEMSCIAGVGGDVKSLLRTARSGRPIIAVDGCPLRCVAQILKRHQLQADRNYDLSKLDVRKRPHEDFDPEQAARVLRQILDDPGFPGGAPGAAANRTEPQD